MSEAPPRILIVDDLIDHRELLSQVLVDLGYEVRTATDGEAALAEIRGGPRPSLVLVDLWMPGMGGSGFLGALRSDPDPAVARLPVVVMTADPEGASVQLQAAPPELLLEKPFGLRELRRAVVRFCGQGAPTRRTGPHPSHDPE
jgi:CheY-like chemotaxis protein